MYNIDVVTLRSSRSGIQHRILFTREKLHIIFIALRLFTKLTESLKDHLL